MEVEFLEDVESNHQDVMTEINGWKSFVQEFNASSECQSECTVPTTTVTAETVERKPSLAPPPVPRRADMNNPSEPSLDLEINQFVHKMQFQFDALSQTQSSVDQLLSSHPNHCISYFPNHALSILYLCYEEYHNIVQKAESLPKHASDKVDFDTLLSIEEDIKQHIFQTFALGFEAKIRYQQQDFFMWIDPLRIVRIIKKYPILPNQQWLPFSNPFKGKGREGEISSIVYWNDKNQPIPTIMICHESFSIEDIKIFLPSAEKPTPGYAGFTVELMDGNRIVWYAKERTLLENGIGHLLQEYNRKKVKAINALKAIHIDFVSTTFDPTLADHTTLFLSLWNGLFPNDPMDTFAADDRWKSLGFQSKKPESDLRAMGIWGLQCLHTFAANHREVLLSWIQEERTYPIAACAINVAYAFCRTFRIHDDTCLDTLPMDNCWDSPLLKLLLRSSLTVPEFFHQTFACYMLHFDRYWLSKEATYMDFPRLSNNMQARFDDALLHDPPSIAALQAALSTKL